MKHDVKIKYDISEKEVAELIDAGYNLIGFSCGSFSNDVENYGIEYQNVFLFSKEIQGEF